MELVVTIEDDLIIRTEFAGQIRPERLEVRCRGNNITIVASVVVRIENCMGASSCDERYDVL